MWFLVLSKRRGRSFGTRMTLELVNHVSKTHCSGSRPRLNRNDNRSLGGSNNLDDSNLKPQPLGKSKAR